MTPAAQPKISNSPILSGYGLLLRMPAGAPLVVSLGGGQWQLREPWTFEIGTQAGGLLLPMTVPVGFISDLYSVPWIFTLLVAKDQKDNRPAFIHDWLYATSGGRSHWIAGAPYARKQCDAALRLAMRGAGIDWLTRWAIYRAVRVGGWLPWRSIEKALHSVTTPMMGSDRISNDECLMSNDGADPELDANDDFEKAESGKRKAEKEDRP